MNFAIICRGSHILLILKSMIFISLAAIFFIFYFTDVVNKFAKRDTILVHSQETIDENERNPPFITFCMIPKAKHSILDGYKFSRGVLNEPNFNDKKILISLNKTVETLFREATFKLDRDFYFSINLWFYEDEFGWTSYTSKMAEGNNNYIEVGIINLERVQIKRLMIFYLHTYVMFQKNHWHYLIFRLKLENTISLSKNCLHFMKECAISLNPSSILTLT